MGDKLPRFRPHRGSAKRTKKPGPRYWGACEGKVRYADLEQAKIAVRTIRQYGFKGGAEQMRAYHCGRCNGYHLSSQEEKFT